MESGDGGSDSVEVVRAFLEKLGGRTPSRVEVMSIRADLEELERRVARLRQLAPAYRAVELGDDVKMLLRVLRGKSGGFRAAASFL